VQRLFNGGVSEFTGFWSGVESFRCFAPFLSLRWQSTSDQIGSPFLADSWSRMTLGISPSGNLRIGVGSNHRVSVFGKPISTDPTWTQLELNQLGEVIYFTTNNGIGQGTFVSNPDGTITAYSYTTALAFSPGGALVNRIDVPPGFQMRGPAFYL